MFFDIQEKILYYPKQELINWKKGIKKVPDFVKNRKSLYTEPEYSFGEIFMLNYYHKPENGNWFGFMEYSLGNKKPGSKARSDGWIKVCEIIPKAKLERFFDISSPYRDVNYGTGEPDLFLYKDSGEYMFAEVKKQGDGMRPMQYTCLAQIIVAFECPVGIVYLAEEGHFHAPKTYRLDLDKFAGEIKQN